MVSSFYAQTYRLINRARVYKNVSRFFLFVFGRQNGVMVSGIPSVDQLLETRHKNLVDVFDNSAQYSTMSKGKNMLYMLANGVIFTTLKHIYR